MNPEQRSAAPHTPEQAANIALLMDEARRTGIEAADEAAAIEALLGRELPSSEPTEEACRRHFDAHRARFGAGERLQLRHVLFAVTPGVDVHALGQRAEALLLELRCAEPHSDAFAAAARRWSNCPTGADGGELGWVAAQDCAPEFARAVFADSGQAAAVGVLPTLVRSRFGLHVVEVRERDPGRPPEFEEVRDAVAVELRQQAWINGVRQYLQRLGGAATPDAR
jgi:peptidyl-prolyl cis-trans isomerase C